MTRVELQDNLFGRNVENRLEGEGLEERVITRVLQWSRSKVIKVRSKAK